jgi:hypothetical protein
MSDLRSRVIRLAHQQPSLRPHLLPLLTRTASTPDTIYLTALKNLSDLSELSENVQEVIDGFNLHYASRRKAGIDPEIQSEKEVFQKASEGLKLADQTVTALTGLVQMFPADKKYAKTLSDSVKLRDTLAKQAEASRKVIRTLSEKKAPKALSDMAKKIKSKIASRLIDPSKVEAFFSQRFVQGEILHSAIFRAEYKTHQHASVDLWLTESATGTAGIRMGIGFGIYAPTDYTPASADGSVDLFFKSLVGWDNVKGEAEGLAQRADTAKDIARALESVTRRLSYAGTDPVEISEDSRNLGGAYRSSLPKEGAYAVGEYEYEEMAAKETALARKAVDAALAPYKDKIAKVDIHAEEKSWIHIDVTLK